MAHARVRDDGDDRSGREDDAVKAEVLIANGPGTRVLATPHFVCVNNNCASLTQLAHNQPLLRLPKLLSNRS